MVLFENYKSLDEQIAELEREAAIDFEETHQAVSYQCTLYMSVGSSDKRRLLERVASCAQPLIAYTAVKALLSYSEILDGIEKYDSPEVVAFKLQNNEESAARNNERRLRAFTMLPPIITALLSTNHLTILTEAMRLLTESKEHMAQAAELYCAFIQTDTIDENFRYKTLSQLESKIGVTSVDAPMYGIDEIVVAACRVIVLSEAFSDRVRILASQRFIDDSSDVLLSIAEDGAREPNTRADAADSLLRSIYPCVVKRAQQVISELGALGGFKLTSTIYNNAQNVHTTALEQSALEIVRFLATYSDNELVFEDVVRQLCEASNDKEKVRSATFRIEVDRAIYCQSFTLKFVFLSLWSYIRQNEHFEALKSRLIEELEEMSGTCSTGYITRLANVVSGFGGMSVSISMRDQVATKAMMYVERMAASITKDELFSRNIDAIRAVSDPSLSSVEEILAEFKENVLCEFGEQDVARRANVSVFIRIVFPLLRESLFIEFNEVDPMLLDEYLVETGRALGM